MYVTLRNTNLLIYKCDLLNFCFYFVDAKANEMVIENLKSILNEQEETMETQDKVLLARDEEIKTLQSGKPMSHRVANYS